MVVQILYTARFIRSLKKLPEDIKEDAIYATSLFKETKNHKRLKLHKLHGPQKGYHSFSINFQYRIVVKITGVTAYFMDIGTHDIYGQ